MPLKMLCGGVAIILGLIGATTATIFPPVAWRFPIPAPAVVRPLFQQPIPPTVDDEVPDIRAQRFYLRQAPVFSQAPRPSEGPGSSTSSEANEDDLPRQVGPVATPAPDGLPDFNSVVFQPGDFSETSQSDSLADRNAFVPPPPFGLVGKSQRPEGVAPPPFTVYRLYRWFPVQFPEDFTPGQATDGPEGVSSDQSASTAAAPSPPPSPPPANPVPNAPPPQPMWIDAPGPFIPPYINGIPAAQVTAEAPTPGRLIPLRPGFTPAKGYAVPDFESKDTDSSSLIGPATSSGTTRPGSGFPGIGPLQTKDSYIGSYLTTLSGYSPPAFAPQTVSKGLESTAVKSPNEFGDLWVFKKDGRRPYFQRLRIPFQPSAPSTDMEQNPGASLFPTKGQSNGKLFGGFDILPSGVVAPVTQDSTPAFPPDMVRLPNSPKLGVPIIQKGSQVGRLVFPRKLPLPAPFIPVSVTPPARLVKAPCPIKPTVLPLFRPALTAIQRPRKTIQLTGKGLPYPGSGVASYSYVMWNPSTRSYVYAVPAQAPYTKPAANMPLPTSSKSVPSISLSGGYWRPVPASRPNIQIGGPDVPRTQALVEVSSEIAVSPQSEASPEVTTPSPVTTSSPSPSSSEASSSESSSVPAPSEPSRSEPLILAESSISRSMEESPQEREDVFEAPSSDMQAPKPNLTRYRSYVFRYDYQNSPDSPSERITRIIPLGVQASELAPEILSSNPFNFHRAVSYVFREDGYPRPNASSSDLSTVAPETTEAPLVTTVVEPTKSSEDSGSSAASLIVR